MQGGMCIRKIQDKSGYYIDVNYNRYQNYAGWRQVLEDIGQL